VALRVENRLDMTVLSGLIHQSQSEKSEAKQYADEIFGQGAVPAPRSLATHATGQDYGFGRFNHHSSGGCHCGRHVSPERSALI
jgi:hypothetical protein